MAINIVHYSEAGAPRWGIVRNGQIIEIDRQSTSSGEFVSTWTTEALKVADGRKLSFPDIKLLPTVTRNQQFICLGANYRQHMIESGLNPDIRTFNMIFTKATGCLCAADSDVIKPANVRFLDYEIELGVIMRAPLTVQREVTEADLPSLIAGLTIVNDYSARDVQIPQMQFYKGKSYRTFGPTGPYLVMLEPEDFPYINALELRLSVNGDLRQRDNTSNLVYKLPETLTELSGMHDLAPGDLIATGTPAGCALTIPPPLLVRLVGLLPEQLKWKIFLKNQSKRRQYLKQGDLVEAKIASADGKIDLGMQSNYIKNQDLTCAQ